MSVTNSESLHGLRNDFGAMLDGGLFTDARLVCFEQQKIGDDGKGEGERKRVEIPVHRAILSVRSKHFADAFADGREELEIPHFPAHIIRLMLSHAYGEKIPGEVNDETLISVYRAATVYDMNTFTRTGRFRGELVLDQFLFAQQSPRTFHGEAVGPRHSAAVWPTTMRMEMRGNRAAGTQRMHMDFKLCPSWQWSFDYPKTLITDLSLSILDGPGGEKLHAVTREGIFHNSLDWSDCLDYSQIVNEILPRQRNQPSSQQQQQVVVLFEATVWVANEFQLQLHRPKDVVGWKRDFTGDLLEMGRFRDGRIVCFDGENGNKVVIPVHRCVLAARAKFFAAVFSTGMCMREAEAGGVVVPAESGISAATVRAMLLFVYTASVPSALDHQARVALFKAAHLYQINGLVSLCAERFQVSPGNWREMLALADLYDNKELRAKALEFANNGNR